MRTIKNGILICVILFVIFVIAGDALAAAKADLDSLFYSANKYYEQGKYEEAARDYEKILNMGFQSGPLYYNLANSYFKLGSLGKTILNYERAKRLMPQNPELEFNYDYVQSLLEDKIELPKKNWFFRKAGDVSEFMPFGGWLGVIAALWFVLIFFMILNIFLPGLKIIIKYFNIVIILILFVCIPCVIISCNSYFPPLAVILSKEAVARYGPGEAEVEAFILHEGTKALIIKEEENWRQIQLPDGKSGWLPKDSAGVV